MMQLRSGDRRGEQRAAANRELELALHTAARRVCEPVEVPQQFDTVGQLLVVETLNDTHVSRAIGGHQVHGRQYVPEDRRIDRLPCRDGPVKTLGFRERLPLVGVRDGDGA